MSERYKIAVAHWAVSQHYGQRYGGSGRAMGHLNKKDCGLDPSTVQTVTFESYEEGGCETCGTFTYIVAEFVASCRCGYVKNVTFEIDMKYKDLSEVLAEIMAAEPFTITELAL